MGSNPVEDVEYASTANTRFNNVTFPLALFAKKKMNPGSGQSYRKRHNYLLIFKQANCDSFVHVSDVI